METSQQTRLPLIELALDPFLEGSSKGVTSKGKTPSSTLKRARSPAPSSSTPLTGSEGWLSPSKRRVLFAEGLLSPTHARITPGRRFFSHVDNDHQEGSPAHESPVSRALFSAREIEPDVMSAFAAAHSHSATRGFDATGTGSTPSRLVMSASAKKASMAMIMATRDDVTVVDNASDSSPATLVSSHSGASTPHSTRPATTFRSGAPPIYRGLEPSPEIEPSTPRLHSASSNHSPATITPKAITLAPPLPIRAAKSGKLSSSAKNDIPSTYSSNPAIALSAPELHFERPSLEESMTFVTGSRHYPGFLIRVDSPPRTSASASPLPADAEHVPNVPHPISGSSHRQGFSDGEESAFEDDDEEDKENAAAIRSVVQHVKRRKLGTPSRSTTPMRELPPIAESPVLTPRQAQQSPERVSKRPRTTASPARLAHSSSSPVKVMRARTTPSTGLSMEAGRDAMNRRAERRRLLEMEVDGQ